MGLGAARDHPLEHVGEPGQGLGPVQQYECLKNARF
jgi:hypothetical protein